MSAILRRTSDSIGIRTVALDLILRILVMIVGEYLRQKKASGRETNEASSQDDQQSI